MRTGLDDAKAASATEIMADARRLQGAHGARVIVAAARKLRQAVTRLAHPQGLPVAGELRLH